MNPKLANDRVDEIDIFVKRLETLSEHVYNMSIDNVRS